MKIKIISCQIFEVYLNHLLNKIESSNSFDVSFFEIDRHIDPAILRKDLQTEIDKITGYDLIILIYGICGNSTTGITARNIRIAIPRVHDCATILLGSKDKYKDVFGHRPSQGWKSISYDKDEFHSVAIESNLVYQEYVKKYGEDNALYIFETLYPISENDVYITLDMEEDKVKLKELKQETEIIHGSLDYLSNIISLNFDDLLVLEPGECVVPVYDFEQVLKKRKL